MKHLLRYIPHIIQISCVLIISLIYTNNIHATTSFYDIRTQRLSFPQWAGMIRHYNKPELDGNYGTWKLTTGYTRSFQEDRIATCLFGSSIVNDCLTPTINISGSRTLNRGENDWLADYFGLATDFKSKLTFEPRISNFITALQVFWDLANCYDGLFCNFYAPFTHTRWKLGVREELIQLGNNDYVQGYFAPNTVVHSNLVQNALDFFSNMAVPNLINEQLVNPIRVIFEPLAASKFSKKTRTQTRFAEVMLEIGYKIWDCEGYSFVVSGFFAAPTGGRPHGTYFFEPIAGNGHHPELGIGAYGFYQLWQGSNAGMLINLWVDAHVSHLFSSKQCRVFDLVGKENSRYMLAERLTSPAVNLFANPNQNTGLPPGSSVAPSAQFNNLFSPVANLTLSSICVKAKVQADVTAMLNFQNCSYNNFDLDVGYRFWARTCDQIKFNCKPRLETEPGWALKGDAHVYGFAATTAGTVTQDDPIALSATESKATIHVGTNNFIDNLDGGDTTAVPPIRATRNPFVDNAQFARFVADNTPGANINDRTIAGQQTKTSKDPILLTGEDINVCSARTKGMSHTLFVNLNYSWFDYECWIPFLGLGGKVEFASRECESDCHQCTPSEWGVWFTIGVSFE